MVVALCRFLPFAKCCMIQNNSVHRHKLSISAHQLVDLTVMVVMGLMCNPRHPRAASLALSWTRWTPFYGVCAHSF